MKLTRPFIKPEKLNSGMTLIEILVVVAILSIMVGVAGVSISLLSSRDAESCAKDINTTLEAARMRTLSQEGNHNFVMDTANGECEITPDGDGEDVPSRVAVSFSSEGTYDLSAHTVIEIAFDKSTGRVSRVTADSVPIDINNVNLIRIHAVSDNGKRATVMLVTATGKHYVEYG